MTTYSYTAVDSRGKETKGALTVADHQGNFGIGNAASGDAIGQGLDALRREAADTRTAAIRKTAKHRLSTQRKSFSAFFAASA